MGEFGMTIHAKLQEILCALMSFKDGLWPLLITRHGHVLLDSLCSMMLAMPLVPLRSLMLKPLQLVNLWVPKLLNLLTWQVTNWCTIGITRNADENFGYATSGDALAFTLWNDSEPNNSGNDENCVNVNQDSDSYVQGKWNDWSCDNQARFVCEIATPSFEVKLKV